MTSIAHSYQLCTVKSFLYLVLPSQYIRRWVKSCWLMFMLLGCTPICIGEEKQLSISPSYRYPMAHKMLRSNWPTQTSFHILCMLCCFYFSDKRKKNVKFGGEEWEKDLRGLERRKIIWLHNNIKKKNLWISHRLIG